MPRAIFYDTIDLDLEAAYAHASEVTAASSMRTEAREAMHAFLERRRSDPARH
ncbi:MAG TPA: hypothetical protein VLF14_11520 [Candidatus Binatia bacterium]|nr:hypothetical protein [Candidatus Binatia bacterium]